PTMKLATGDHGLVPHAFAAETRQKYCVAGKRLDAVNVVSASVVSTTRLVNAASVAICKWYWAAPKNCGLTNAAGLRAGTKGAVQESVGCKGTLAAPSTGLMICGAWGVLASRVNDAEAVRAPAGGGVTATPDTVKGKTPPALGRVVRKVSVVLWPGDRG